MAIIHRTGITPNKLELLTEWLPGRPWYQGEAPVLAKAGGFRLDDPDGEVGLEFMVVTDADLAYLVPLTYRAGPLDGAGHALVGTAEHGVLGKRWIYDGVHDPVLVSQLAALLHGDAAPQHQSVSDTPEPSVTVLPLAGPLSADGFTVADAAEHTDLLLGGVTVRVARILRPGAADPATPGQVTAPWTPPGGGTARAAFFTALG